MKEIFIFNSKKSIKVFFSYLVLILVLSGCEITLISSYDENTDKTVTQLQKDFEKFFAIVDSQIGLPECKHSNHKKFYQNSKIVISTIEVLTRAIPNNQTTTVQVRLLSDNLFALESLDKIDFFTNSQIGNLRSNFNTSIASILKLEQAINAAMDVLKDTLNGALDFTLL